MEELQRQYLDSLIFEFEGLEDEELAYLIEGLTKLRLRQAMETSSDETNRELQYFISEHVKSEQIRRISH